MGRRETRFDGPKRTFPKPINLSAQVLLDRERCVSCARCTRFSDEIAGDPLIELLDRGSQQQVGIATDQALQLLLLRQHHSDLPGRCADQFDVPLPLPDPSTWSPRPRRASTAHRAAHSARTAVATPSCDGLAAVDPEVNEEWNCDKGRFAFRYVDAADRLSNGR